MEDLPSGVLVMILDKLASQDVPSSLRATWACSALYSAGKEASHVWKRAFLTPLETVFENIPKLSSRELCDLEESLDADVEALGGYKAILVAKLGHAVKVKKALFSHEQAENAACVSQDPRLGRSYRHPPESELARNVLILVRVYGLPVSYGVYNPRDKLARVERADKYLTLQLQTITTVRPKDIHAKVVLPDGQIDKDSFYMEFYGSKRLPHGSKGRDQQLWCGNFAVQNASGYYDTPDGVGQKELLFLRGTMQRADTREMHISWAITGYLRFEGPERPGWWFNWDAPPGDLDAFWTQYEWE